ncbi:endonuclease/exonuclease/phosphatase family protein [Danxiaibacter flavus]|uniref:Endonuclease/exonuclease/phosphatase family protein n=1 Tax=Danxiaibacter flavus TaxID=3049108 RepID=A0ABV3ZL79_9BACT|nr:endonuclease/exonuclease/phosphatase family protein [Chitinophagaceae bacterium DXS]
MAGSYFRSFTKIIFIVANILLSIAFVTACFAPFLNPATWWIVGFLGLAVPYLITLHIFAIIFWLIAKPRWALLSFFTLIVGYKQINVLFAQHLKAGFTQAKKKESIRIVDWNVGSMYGLSKNNDQRKHNRTEIAEAIEKLSPDVICLQEFNHSLKQGPQADNISLFTDKYPYYFFSKDYDKDNGFYQYGSVIFSKFPIVKKGRTKYPSSSIESLIFVDVVKGEDTIRVFTTHLQSFKFTQNDYQGMQKIREQDNEMLEASKGLFKKMKLAFSRRGVQAETVRKQLDASPYASFICGDFNDVPNSYAYFHIRGDWQDVFLKKGFGIGRTFNAIAPTLRIDYILPDNHFVVEQFDMVDEDLSDHLMLVSDLSLKK